MVMISRKTISALAKSMAAVYSHTKLDALAYEMDMEKDARGSNLQSRALNIVKALDRSYSHSRDDSDFLAMARKVFQDAGSFQLESENLTELRRCLEQDGYTCDGSTIAASGDVSNPAKQCAILPYKRATKGKDQRSNPGETGAVTSKNISASKPTAGTNATNTVEMDGQTLIVHGHVEQERLELKELLHEKMGLPIPIVMKDSTTPGKTLPEKFEKLAKDVDFAIALLTPDDKVKSSLGSEVSHRARQNVLIEIGWFWGRLGRDRILLLVKGDVDIPTDLAGLEYFKFTNSPIECSEQIRAFYKSHGVDRA